MDRHFLEIDDVITQHTSAYLNIDEQNDSPQFLTLCFSMSNQIAVDAVHTRVRDALITIDHLPIK